MNDLKVKYAKPKKLSFERFFVAPPRKTIVNAVRKKTSAEKSAAKRAKSRLCRRLNAASSIDFLWSLSKAHDCGLELKKNHHGGKHYTLSSPEGWVLDIYPATRGLHYQPGKAGPIVEIKDDWNLYDVVCTIGQAYLANIARDI